VVLCPTLVQDVLAKEEGSHSDAAHMRFHCLVLPDIQQKQLHDVIKLLNDAMLFILCPLSAHGAPWATVVPVWKYQVSRKACSIAFSFFDEHICLHVFFCFPDSVYCL
jgi:hypothetical protein